MMFQNVVEDVQNVVDDAENVVDNHVISHMTEKCMCKFTQII